MENRFLVPQHIETEPKIMGPVTVRQFLEMLAVSIVDFGIWKLLGGTNEAAALAIIFTLTFIVGIIAFARVNGQAFHYFLLNLIRTLKRPTLKIWKKESIKIIAEELPPPPTPAPKKPLPPRSHLADLTLLVDTGGAYNVAKQNVKDKVEEMNI
ncbi:PrgI family protein [Candidatus Falkowbacteria bacterium]|nr:PrgI family protein [Candidatus Falkowbacteria bacterium]